MSEYYAPDLECVGLIPLLEERVTLTAGAEVTPFANAPAGTAAVLFTAQNMADNIKWTFLGASMADTSYGHNLLGNYFLGSRQGFLHITSPLVKSIKAKNFGMTDIALWVTYFGYRKGLGSGV
jgi:hypothetical protein